MVYGNMVKRRSAYLIVVGLSLLITFLNNLQVQASTYYVATTGNDSYSGSELQPFQTIKKGLSVLSAGDKLYIRGGIYAERINSNAQSIPTGSSWQDAPEISAYSEEAVVLQPIGGREVINLAHAYIKYVVFSNLIVDASGLQRTCSVGYGCSYGVSGTNGAHHVRFVNTEIKNAAGSGVLITRGSSSAPTYFEFIGCDAHHNGIDPSDHGYYLATSGNLVRNGKVHHNSGHGVHIYTGNVSVTADNNTIDGNDIYSNAVLSGSAPGILLDYGTGNRAINNIVRGNKNGIHVGNHWTSGFSATGTKVYNNTIYANLPGVGLNIAPSASQTEVKNNIIYKNGSTILNTGSNVINTNNLLVDPRFVDEFNNNFKLQLSSPAVNQGVLLTEVPYDHTRITRPQGGTHDIGAHEYSSTNTDTIPPIQPVIKSITTP